MHLLLRHCWTSKIGHQNQKNSQHLENLFLHYKHVLKKANCKFDEAKLEFADLKAFFLWLESAGYLRSKKSYHEIWQRIFSEQSELKNILLIVSLCLLLPLSTSICERGFSAMNRLKSDSRSRLLPKSVSELMNICLNGVSLANYDSTSAVNAWYKSAMRQRRPFASCHRFHKCPSGEMEDELESQIQEPEENESSRDD